METQANSELKTAKNLAALKEANLGSIDSCQLAVILDDRLFEDVYSSGYIWIHMPSRVGEVAFCVARHSCDVITCTLKAAQ